jgi:ferredoxin-NADP reductase/ferredoxin/truncated hemoglobin YjbI
MSHPVEYEGREYSVREGETILRALLRQGVNINYSCGKGSCHTCMCRLVSGSVESSRDIDPALSGSGHFLPCVSRPKERVVVGPPDLDALAKPAEVIGRRLLADDILELDIAPMGEVAYEAGQHIHIAGPDGLSRPYSITTLPGEDFFLRIHVRRVDGGAMSGWLFDHADSGTTLSLRGPYGDCFYDPRMQGRPLLLLGTGTGAGALMAIARAALSAGHTAPVTLFHGGRRQSDLYLHEVLCELAREHANFTYVPCLSREEARGCVRQGRIVEHAFTGLPDLQDAEIFLCGLPAMVEQARVMAIVAGARRDAIHVDPFDFAHGNVQDDASRVDAIPADPELWAALGNGPGLTAVLTDFYQRLFQDARLSPFFHGMLPQQVAAKQYGFLADLISGRREYFGLNPYNAHHWMVISDELFDYREAMFEEVLREHGLAPHLVRRFLALHERFRTSIVKAEAVPMRVKGVDIPLRTQSVERLDLDTVCDGCHQEIPAGSPARYHERLGTLHCRTCAQLTDEEIAEVMPD